MEDRMNSEEFLAAGDSSILVKFGDEIREETNKIVNKFNRLLISYNHKAIIDTIPSYCSLLVNYKPELIGYEELIKFLRDVAQNIDSNIEQDKEVIEIPVLYGNEKGLDIKIVASHNNLSIEDVISLHSSPEYLIYMLGFTPGFPYLGGMNKRIATPRLETPRLKIEAGSVGIAGEQTGIYPISSPGGWQIIGQTPIELFNINRKEPILLKAGQYIKFKSINEKEFDGIKAKNEENKSLYSSNDNYNYQSKKGFKIRNQGFLTTIQDRGRYKYQAFGVPVSGAMDTYSMNLANILVDNDIDEAVLEATMIGPTIEFTEDNIIAITGANLMPQINNEDVSMNTALICHKGDILSFKGVNSGNRAYIAFAGGLSVQEVMGSKSTYIKAGIGGYMGRKLEKNDEVGFENPKISIVNLSCRKILVKEQYNNQFTKESPLKLRVIMGPQEDCFTEIGINTFLNSVYTVSNEFDRMGCRLEGEKIQHIEDGNIISDGIAFGAIQVPSHGTPIIMLADRQTVGGYAKIANVISVDLPKLAQTKPGDKIFFEKITIEEAQNLYIRRIDELEKIKRSFSDKVNSNLKHYHIRVNNKLYDVEVCEMD
jgi:KipI family sensor histidine kinase inhibitor